MIAEETITYANEDDSSKIQEALMHGSSHILIHRSKNYELKVLTCMTCLMEEGAMRKMQHHAHIWETSALYEEGGKYWYMIRCQL